MANNRELWNTVSLHPLSGPLDTRSRPAEVPVGGWRWKLNWAVTSDGKLCRRSGFSSFYSDASSFTNHDYHHQGRTREPVTFQFESTANDGTRQYFLGTQSSVSLLDPATGLYTDILTGMGADQSRWRAATLQNELILCNNTDNVQHYNVSTSAKGTIPDLTGVLHVTTARFAIQFSGFMLLMNVMQDGVRQGSRVVWSDLNDALSYDPAKVTAVTTTPIDSSTGLPGAPVTSYQQNSLAGFQDLDYGDEILAAAPMLGALYIYTRRAIWRVAASGDPNSVFVFNRVYTEPKNQTACLAYPNTLVSTGTEHWFMSTDGLYKFSPYIPTPERQDWLYRASGLIFRKLDTQLDASYCQSPVMEYVAGARELWISWPTTADAGINSWTLVAQIEQKTADVVDHGFTSLVNFRRTPLTPSSCNEIQDFLGASGVDWSIKSIGGDFQRELWPVTDPTIDIPLAAGTPLSVGYNSILRALIPLGLTDREKIIRKVLLDCDVTYQDPPCAVRLRIGNSQSLMDVNDTEDVCAPLWRQLKDLPLACPDPAKLSVLKANNQRPAKDLEWSIYDQGVFLYFEMTITNADDSPAIGGDLCCQRLDFEAMALPKR